MPVGKMRHVHAISKDLENIFLSAWVNQAGRLLELLHVCGTFVSNQHVNFLPLTWNKRAIVRYNMKQQQRNIEPYNGL